jgi:hypothetical protein
MIKNQIVKPIAIKKYIHQMITQKNSEWFVPVEHQLQLTEDVMKDLELLDPIRIAGLGVTRSEFENWAVMFRSEHKTQN